MHWGLYSASASETVETLHVKSFGAFSNFRRNCRLVSKNEATDRSGRLKSILQEHSTSAEPLAQVNACGGFTQIGFPRRKHHLSYWSYCLRWWTMGMRSRVPSRLTNFAGGGCDSTFNLAISASTSSNQNNHTTSSQWYSLKESREQYLLHFIRDLFKNTKKIYFHGASSNLEIFCTKY
jgi:hypothetical protein